VLDKQNDLAPSNEVQSCAIQRGIGTVKRSLKVLLDLLQAYSC
jgi:hypothetical protein